MTDFDRLQNISDDMLRIGDKVSFSSVQPTYLKMIDSLLAEALPIIESLLGPDSYDMQEINELIRRREKGVPLSNYEWIRGIATSVEGSVSAVKYRALRAKKSEVRKAAAAQTALTEKPAVRGYIDQSRIEELKQLPAGTHDFRKLVQLCHELNIAHVNDCFFSMAMLLRAIIDHIPPVFGVSVFSEVGAQYGSKSFKGSMKSLHGSLKNIADHHLHGQIAKSVTLANAAQVSFAPDIDVLLAEVIKIARTTQIAAPVHPSAHP